MGQEISKSDFSQSDFEEFRHRLRQETKILMEWFKNKSFETTNGVCGLELEAWLIDQDNRPLPKNEEFLGQVNDPLVVSELAKFNFELNSHPCHLSGPLFSKLHRETKTTWDKCQSYAHKMNAKALMIGILPTVSDDMLTLKHLSSLQRYLALNQQILKLRGDTPIKLDIRGKERLKVSHNDIMLEAAATSLQIHLQVNQEEAVRFYNASQIISAPVVAASANSPYLFGRDLWDESRIPTFEQAVSVASFRDSHGDHVGRVTFGTGYARHSLFEVFLENLDGYPTLLPLVIDSDPAQLDHLRLHNGTIWRWNRPIIGVSKKGQPHLRLEHRVAASGPSLTDSVANIALFTGLAYFYARQETPPETLMHFDIAKGNFYECAKKGLNAEVNWFGNKASMQTVLLHELLPQAKQGLADIGVANEDISYYLDEVIKPRLQSGQNGAQWQRSYIAAHGPDYQAMTQAYIENQQQDRPVHEWKL